MNTLYSETQPIIHHCYPARITHRGHTSTGHVIYRGFREGRYLITVVGFTGEYPALRLSSPSHPPEFKVSIR